MSENNIVALIKNNEIQDFLGHNPNQYNVNHVFENGSTLLAMAVKKHNLRDIEFIVNRGANINQRETAGATPLLLAVYLNLFEIVKFLIEKGASINIGDSFETPLMMATRKGYLKIIEFLVVNGANINSDNLEGISPIFWAIREKKISVLEKLISKGGIPIGTKNSSGDSPLIYAIKSDCHKLIIQCLLKYGADVNEAPLAWAASRGNLNVVEVLIEYGADSNQIGSDGNTPLATAVRYYQTEIVKYLVGQSVNICKVGKKGKTPLLWAVENRDLEMVKYLLDHGAEYIIDSVFLKAIATKNLEIVQYLHERGAYKNKKYNINDNNDVTPLAKALQVESYEIARFLLENGSTRDDLEDNDIWYLLKFLEKKNRLMVELLTEYGVELNKSGRKCGHTPLTKSTEMEDFEMVRYFIEHGANVNQLNTIHQTPLGVAAKVRNFRIFQYLADEGANFENDPLKDDETMIRYYEIAKGIISEREKLRSVFLGAQEEAENSNSCEDEVKEKSLAEKNYYAIEFD